MTPSEQTLIDAEQLKMLRMGYFVSAAMAGFFACGGLFYMAMGLVFGGLFGKLPRPAGHGDPPAGFFMIFVGIGFALFAMASTVVFLKLRTARNLRLRTGLTLCKVTAAISCLEVPYGTALGVWTFVVLSRPSIRGLFPK